MKSTSRTTFILLERGSEDMALFNDIQKAIADLGGLKVSHSRYPMLFELYSELQDELRGQKDDA